MTRVASRRFPPRLHFPARRVARSAALAATGALAFALAMPGSEAHAREVACSAGQTLKSENGNTKSLITFTNRTTDKQTIYWIDYEGKRNKYQELNAGESYDQPTFLTHPWLVTGLRDKCVGYYLAEGKRTSVEPGLAPKLKPRVKPKEKQVAAVTKPATESATPEVKPETTPERNDRVEIDDDVDSFPSESLVDDDTREFAERRQDDLDEPEIDNDDTAARGDERGIDEDDEATAQADAEPIVRARPRRERRTARVSPEWGDDLSYGEDSALARDWRCAEYRSRTQSTICRNRRLNRLDNELRDLYASLIRALPRRQQVQLRRRQERWTERRDNCGDRTRCIERRTERRMARLNDRLENVIRRRNAGSDIDLDDDASSDTSGGASRLVICARGFVDNGSGRCIRDRGRAEQREATLGDDSFAGGSTGAGRSLGGNVRDIPGLDGRQTAKLREGERVELIENTGERYQGYDWFKIRHRGGVGYQWGGILCANRRTSGVYEVCR